MFWGEQEGPWSQSGRAGGKVGKDEDREPGRGQPDAPEARGLKDRNGGGVTNTGTHPMPAHHPTCAAEPRARQGLLLPLVYRWSRHLLVGKGFPASWSREGAGWGTRMTAADRLRKGKGGVKSWACQEAPGERGGTSQAPASGPLLGTCSLGRAGAGLDPTSSRRRHSV